ncbi:hypothetical protein QQF21_06880 [Lelliottia sp. V89_10]|uniref:MrpH family fimbial adhesin n=1 Tax=Lelliottia wanjuensis TaxID=3050585 RepID=UPI00249E5D1B|nr:MULTISPECIES: hypothetical protein [unclassified Lelliottia]MDI3360204.1 hypothetical protein [Lelliottia sp. V89_13]MDK9550124.1 hypothetical protein [Lelliottia sp. V89_5]MDK9595336.1 hypothetical protein [Lelliottia sp. V89_10]
MKKMFYFTLRMMFLLFIFSASQFSLAGQYPVITSVTARVVDPYNTEYHWSGKLAEIGSASETMVPFGYMTGLGFKDINGGFTVVRFVATTTYSGSQTPHPIGDLARGDYVSDVDTNRFTFTVPPDEIPGEGDRCLAYVSVQQNNAFWSNAINPAGCTYIPPATEMCKITTPEILLDHGSITLKDAEGNVAKSNVGVSCTTPMSVTFHLTTDSPYINLSPSGKSEIKIEDQALGSKIDLPAGAKMLSITDMLSGVSTEGVNAGSSVLVMEPY